MMGEGREPDQFRDNPSWKKEEKEKPEGVDSTDGQKGGRAGQVSRGSLPKPPRQSCTIKADWGRESNTRKVEFI